MNQNLPLKVTPYELSCGVIQTIDFKEHVVSQGIKKPINNLFIDQLLEAPSKPALRFAAGSR
jgi:hypothetical protein